jgi:hypothetical protein
LVEGAGAGGASAATCDGGWAGWRVVHAATIDTNRPNTPSAGRRRMAAV